MSSEQKDATMRAFAAGDIDVLVATTVIVFLEQVDFQESCH